MKTIDNTTPRDKEIMQAPYGSDHEETDIRELIGSLLDGKWLILSIAAVVLFLGTVYAVLSAPIYSSDALVQVEQKKGGTMGLADPASFLFGGMLPTDTERELIRSRSIIGAAVEDLRLDIQVTPKRFPLIGGFIARRYNPAKGLAQPILSLTSYAWGGERISIASLEVGEGLKNKDLALIAGAKGSFTLLGPDGEILIKGVTGRQAKNDQISISVTALEARPGTEFSVMKHSITSSVEFLQKNLQVQEQGKQTGLIRIALEGADKALTTAIVNTIADKYLIQNVERRSEEAKKMLDFLATQMPKIRDDVQAAEAALNSYRSKKGAVDVSLEAQAYLQGISAIDRELTLVNLEKAELAQKYTGRHPALIALDEKISKLTDDKERINSEFRHLPQAEIEAVRLQRDAKVANDVYVTLLNKQQELSVAKAGTIGNVRIIDRAEFPIRPIKPKRLVIVMASLLLGFFIGVGVVFVKRALSKGVEDPNEVERRTGLPVYATIPHSAKQTLLEKAFKTRPKDERLLTKAEPGDLSIESLRSLRTSLQFALLDSPNRVIAITGPSPSIGKSFVSANFAAILAETGKKVLVMDADMRKGHLWRHFGSSPSKGLSELISGSAQPEEAIVATEIPTLSLLASGAYPPNPSELLMSERFESLMDEFKGQYDFVVVDTPPLLAVTDAAIVGRHAGINFIVVKAGTHDIEEIEVCYKRLSQNGVKVQGVIFNDMILKKSKHGYGYGYKYHYSYDYSASKKKS